MQALREYSGNPASTHAYGKKAAAALEEAKERIAKALNCEPSEVFFTSSATESINTVIKGQALQTKARDGYFLTFAGEHPATAECFKFIQEYYERKTKVLPLKDHLPDLSALEDFVNAQDLDFFSTLYVNNISGAITPVREIVKLLRTKAPQARIHLDAVQALGKLPLDFKGFELDYLSLSLHKLGCPKGSGILLMNKDKPILPLLHGGGQQQNFRSSTENAPLAIVSAAVIERAVAQQEANYTKVTTLKQLLLSKLAEARDQVFDYSLIEAEKQVPHIVSLIIPALRGQNIQAALSKQDIHIGIGSACASRKAKPPQALLDQGLSDEEARHIIRLSLAPEHSEEDLSLLVANLAATVRRYAIPERFRK